MKETPATRRSLILRIRDADNHQAWAEFTEIYEPLVYRLARGNGFQHADAADLTQDVLSAVAKAIDRWDPAPERGSFRSWLYRIARNLMINLMIQQQRHPRGAGDTDIKRLLDEVPNRDSQASVLFDHEYRRELFQWAARQVQPTVRKPTWEAFWRTCIGAEPISRVAGDLEMTPGAVYIARSRVMVRLRKAVEQYQQKHQLP